MVRIEKFEDLNAWKEARKLSNMVYILCKKLNLSREFDLSNQIKRAYISIMANIAEGFGRYGFKDSKHFFTTAKGSLLETQSHLYSIKDLGFLKEDEFMDYYRQSVVANKLLSGLIANTIKQIVKN